MDSRANDMSLSSQIFHIPLCFISNISGLFFTQFDSARLEASKGTRFFYFFFLNAQLYIYKIGFKWILLCIFQFRNTSEYILRRSEIL